MTEHLPERPTERGPMRHYMTDPDNEDRLLKVPHRVVADIEARIREDERSNNFTPDDFSDAMSKAYQRGLDAARETIAKTHSPIPVVQCACGWGVNCPECGSQSNRTVGFVCRVCCDDWDDHGYCDDMHNEDDTPIHHVGGEMWSGPFCPVIAAIDALRNEES